MIRGERGASLAEAMVALGLFAMTLAAVGSFLVTHIRRAAWSHQRTYAYTLAEQELEAMRALDYEALASRSRTEVLGGTTFTVTTSVADNAPVPQVKTIAVSVSWTDPRGAQQVDVSAAYAKVRR